VLFAVDVYYTKKKNFISAVTTVSPVAGFVDIQADLVPALAAAIAANPGIAPALGAFGLTSTQVATLLVGLGGDQLAALPVAVVQPDQNKGPGEILAAYRNFGDVDFWGIDATLQILATPRLNLFGNISYVSDDFFDNEDLGETNPAIFQALNATKFKAKGGFSYSIPSGFTFNASGRYTKAFPVASGPYVGGLPITVAEDIGGLENYFILDVGAGFDFSSYASGLRIDFTVQNVLDNTHREFIGAPQIGRLALARFTYSR
jgi:iron complex outermembrane receptor protein